MTAKLYSVGTWDGVENAYTPQVGLSVPSLNIELKTLRVLMRQLQSMGYSCHRRREAGRYDDNDTSVLIERTDGKPEAEILRQWER